MEDTFALILEDEIKQLLRITDRRTCSYKYREEVAFRAFWNELQGPVKNWFDKRVAEYRLELILKKKM